MPSQPGRVPLAAALLLMVACTPPLERPPVLHEAQPLDAVNTRLVGTAPATAGKISSERLIRALSEPQNWLTYHGAYDAQRFSPLDQINRGNVTRLRPAWVFQSPPIGLIANA